MEAEKMISSETVFEGKIISVTVDTVELKNHATAKREVVHHHGGAGVVAINDKGEIVLVRQYRYALGKELIEIPAGKIEKGEDPKEAAYRELEEEAACRAGYFEAFDSIIPTCGYCDEIIYLFLAKDLTETKQNLDEDEFVDFFWIPLDEAFSMVMSGEITDSKTAVGILKAKALKDSGKL